MKKIVSWLLPIAWMGVIFYSSAQPYQDQDVKPLLENTIDLSFLKPMFSGIAFVYHQSEVSVANLGIYGFIEFFIRKGAHVGVFLVLFLLLYLAFAQTFTQGKWNINFAFIITVIYAALDEWHQGFTPNRTPFIGDVILDSIGAMIGVGLVLFILWWRKKKVQ
ncbi:VanZ family protein [Paraliobacillus quinghaiensis]|uniref:VanZ family protein n=1 Tax=Paraliobacillus quinghaiensis TaxID=470815 RepID=A0A917WWL9_9BACI|nr:VanZ family protein [Paraliobacillus quinghaiensis]GGM35533.1 VanZ family protein [Paraliobacillus quinghaiensis]